MHKFDVNSANLTAIIIFIIIETVIWVDRRYLEPKRQQELRILLHEEIERAVWDGFKTKN